MLLNLHLLLLLLVEASDFLLKVTSFLFSLFLSTTLNKANTYSKTQTQRLNLIQTILLLHRVCLYVSCSLSLSPPFARLNLPKLNYTSLPIYTFALLFPSHIPLFKPIYDASDLWTHIFLSTSKGYKTERNMGREVYTWNRNTFSLYASP